MGQLIRMIEVDQEIQTETGVWVIDSIEGNSFVTVRINGSEVVMTDKEVLAKIFDRKDVPPHLNAYNRHQVGIVLYYPIENDYSLILLPSMAKAKSFLNAINVFRQEEDVDLQQVLENMLPSYPHEEFEGIAEEEIWEKDGKGFAQYVGESLDSWYVQVLNANEPIVIGQEEK